MIRAFWQSKLTAGSVWALSMILAAVIWVRDIERGYPIYIPIAAAVLVLAIGTVAGRLAGNIAANSCNTKLLGLLHVELDPKAFLRGYEAVPERLKVGSWDYAVARAYLADGYAAAGDFDRAIATLCPECSGTPQAVLAVRGLYYSDLCSYALAKGDLNEAREAANALDEVVRDPQASSAFAQNMGRTLTLCRERLSCLEGGKVDRQWLTGQLAQATYTLRRLEILQALAQWAIREDRRAEALDYLEQIDQGAGKTYYREWSRQERERLTV